MKTLRSSSFILVLFLILGAYSEDKNSFKAPPFKIAPESQTVSLSIGGGATFHVINLGGCNSVRIEFRLLPFGAWVTMQGFEAITSPGFYIKSTQEISDLLGLGIFLWRITDNNNINYSSEPNLLIVIN